MSGDPRPLFSKMTGAERLAEVVDVGDGFRGSAQALSRFVTADPHIEIQRGANGALMPSGYDLIGGIAHDHCACPICWKLYSVQQLRVS